MLEYAGEAIDVRPICDIGRLVGGDQKERSGGKLADAAGLCIRVPSRKTNEIQEMHIAIGHLLCGLIEDAIC